MTETQQIILEWFLIFVIVVSGVRIVWLLVSYFLDRLRYNRYAKEFFKKIEEHRSVFD